VGVCCILHELFRSSKGKKYVGVDGVDDGDDVVEGKGGATTQASHVDVLIDPFFPRLPYTRFRIASVAHAAEFLDIGSVEVVGITNHTRNAEFSSFTKT
jgi:hypothetical protein